MELKQVEAFLAVAAHSSFSRAAGALHLTQPSVTARIQALERELGQPLFQRTGRGVTLTEVGESYLPFAQRVAKALQDGRDAVLSLGRLELGTLRLAAAPSVGAYVLPELLKVYGSRYPGLDVSVRTAYDDRVIQMVLSDDVDVALDSASTHPDCVTVPLYDEETALVCGRDGELAQAVAAVPAAEIAERGLILVNRRSRLTTLALDALRQAGASGSSAIDVDGMEAAKEMAAQGLGVAVLPVVAVRRELERGELHRVTVAGLQLPRTKIALIHRRGRTLSAAAQAFVDLLEEHFGVRVSDT